MSAQDEEEGSSLPKKSKHSRMRGACDACRQKKMKCDSAKMPKNRCSRCTASGLDCTHFYMMKRALYSFGSMGNTVPAPILRGLGLEEAKARMGPLLDTILSPLYQLPADPIVLHETMTSLAQYARALEKFLAEKIPEQFSEESPSPNHSSSADAGEAVTSPGDDSKNEPENPLYDDISALSDTLRENLLLESFAPQRFYGASSTIMLVKAAIDLNVAGTEQTIACLAKNKRPEFWTVRPWEVIPDPEYPPYVFPEPDLLCHLVEEYFTKSNPMFPLLNRSIFENGVRAGLHLVDDEFGGIVLGVCAVAALYSRDPRILLDVPHAEQSAGFKYYRQLRLSRDSFLRAPTLQELQTHTLAATFLRASSRLDKCWHLLGVTLRAVQEIGLNRKQKNDKRSVAQSELCKRVFFCLWSMEQFVGAALGRPSCMRRADYGIDRPIECDDEFWENENPELAFKQPPGRHSEVTFFNRLLDLLDIFDGVQAAIYSVQKPISPKGFSTEEWNERQLAEFDSELNNWYENLPEFLRWDPDAPNSAFFNQSAKLYISFYWVKILMHRPFIALKNKVTKTFSSMAICTNSARAIIRIMTIQNQKGVPLPLLGISLNLSATVLLVNMWKERKSGNPIDEEREIDYIIKCIKILRSYDRCWQFTGRCCDLLYTLLALNELTMDRPPPAFADLIDFPLTGKPGDLPAAYSQIGMSPELACSNIPRAGARACMYPAFGRPPLHVQSPSTNIQTQSGSVIGTSPGILFAHNFTFNDGTQSSHGQREARPAGFNTYGLPSQGTVYQDFAAEPDNQMDFSFGIPIDFDSSEWTTYLDNLGAMVSEAGNYQTNSQGSNSYGFY